MSNRQLFHSLMFHDSDRAIAFLTAVGFTEAAVYRDESGAVMHAQFNWRDTGAVMFGQVSRADGDADRAAGVGKASCYCVVQSDEDVDKVYADALAASATEIQAPMDPDYGGRSCTVADHEGNQWSFGSYAGA